MSKNQRKEKEQAQRRVINKGRHAEFVDRNKRYYLELNDHLSFREFKNPQYVDQDGRLYCVATTIGVRTEQPIPITNANARGRVKLDVKLPKGVEWYPQNKARILLELMPVRGAGTVARTVVLRERYISQPGHRTGHIYVSKSEWEMSAF